MVQELGFELGMHVQRRADKAEGEILEMSGSSVVLAMEAGRFNVDCSAFMKNEWKIVKKSMQPVQFPYDVFKEHCGHQNHAMAEIVAKGQLAEALLKLEEKFLRCVQGVSIAWKPSRGVVAVQRFPKGKLTLAPSSYVISRKATALGVKVEMGMGGEDVWYLHPCICGPDNHHLLKPHSFLAPFWFVKKSAVAEEANVHMKNVNSGSMVIPCLVNSKEVNEQEELIQYSPKPEPEAPTELVPVETGKRGKRCKQS